jgi:uncharacterized protein (TIGR03435 family)
MWTCRNLNKGRVTILGASSIIFMAYCRLLMLPLAMALLAAGQSFEAATIKLNQSGPTAPNGFSPSPGGLRAVNSTLEQMIHAAFHVKTGALAGLSGWMETERWDVDGKTSATSTFDEELVMLRELLIERFQLRFHSETRQVTTFALLTGKSGPKFESSKTDAKERITIRPGEISGANIPFGHFVTVLAAQVERPITDETGLHGNFDLVLKYVRDDSPDAASGPSLFAALNEQLGLKLESRKGPIEVMVIDSARRPASN